MPVPATTTDKEESTVDQSRISTPVNAESGRAPANQYDALTNRQLVIFAGSQLIVWALNAANVLETSFILPVVAQEFKVSISDVQWVAASNMLIWGCFQLIAGRLCDILGRKRGYIFGCTTSVIFNVTATFMPNLASLNVARALSGLSAAIILPASAGLIGALYRPGKKRTIACAVVSCGGCAGASVGELLAGVFVRYSKWTWRPCYFSCGVTTVAPLIIGWWLVPRDPPIKSDWSVDWLGALSVGVSLFLFLFTLTLSNTTSRGWKTPYLPALLTVSVLCFAFFVWRQRSLHRALPSENKPPPVIPKGLLSWKKRNLIVVYIGTALLFACVDGQFPFISYLYLDVLKLDAFEAGLRWSMCMFSGVPAAILVALLISRVPPRILMSTGCLISTMTPLLFAIRKLDWPYWRADLWAFLLVAYGSDGVIAAGSSLISHTASPEDQSVASALFQTSCRLGYAVGLAICTSIQTTFENRDLKRGKTLEHATVTGLRAALWTCTIYMGMASLTFLFGMKGWACIHDTEHGQIDGDEESRPALTEDVETRRKTQGHRDLAAAATVVS